MASNLTISWSPPPLTELNYTNCTAASALIASSVTLNATLDIGYYATINFLRSLVPLNSTDNDHPTNGELLLWSESWNTTTENEIYDNAWESILECGRKICRFLPLEGDPDLAGIGIYSWFEQTLNSFLDASLLFSISMLLAAIYRFSSAYRHPDGEDNTFIYSLINAVTVSMFSVFPPLILQFTGRKLRRRFIRAILWFLVIAFAITLTILYYKWRGPDPIVEFFHDDRHFDDELNRHMGHYMWLMFCDLTDVQLIQSLDRAIITAQVALSLNSPCWFYLVYTIRDTKQEDFGAPQDPVNDDLHHTRSRAWKSYGKYAPPLNILICYVTMWLLLGTFTTIAVRLAVAMGPFGKDRRWSIGQILAMATFVPLIIDIGAIVLDEPKRALEGKLPRNLRVVEAGGRSEATNEGMSRRFGFNNKRRQADYEMLENGPRTPRN